MVSCHMIILMSSFKNLSGSRYFSEYEFSVAFEKHIKREYILVT